MSGESLEGWFAAEVLADALEYHAREEKRLTSLSKRRWVTWFGPIHVYGEAIYAHHAAQVHLRRLAKALGHRA